MVGELQVDNVAEVFRHQFGDHFAQRRGTQVLSFLDDIVVGGDGRNGRGVGGRTADPLFLHGTDQRCLGIAGGGLGKLLFGDGFIKKKGLPFLQFGKAAFVLFLIVVGGLLIDSRVAGELQTGTAGAELAAAAFHLDGDVVIDSVCHLAGRKAPPDDAVKAILFLGEVLLHQLGCKGHIGRADRLVGVLGAGLRLVHTRLRRAVCRTVAVRNEGACGRNGLVREPQRVGAHVADQTDAATAGDLNAFIELLGHGHRPPRGHVQTAGSLLLERGGDKGRRGRALLFGFLNRGDREGMPGDGLTDLLHLVFGVQFALFPVHAVKAGAEAVLIGAALQKSIQKPVLPAFKPADFFFAVHDHTRGNRLHPSRRKAALDLFPEQG